MIAREHNRVHRELQPGEYLSLLPANESDIQSASKNLLGIIDGLDDKFFLDGVASGKFAATHVQRDGKPCYLFIYHVTDAGALHINASLFVGEGNSDSAVWGKGAEAIAAQLGLKRITFQTKRKAHVMQGQTWGAKVIGVVMEKKL